MIIRRTDVNGDFVFGHGLADYLTYNEAVALLVKQRLLLWLAEWFLDINAGVNWPGVLGVRPPAILLADQEIRRVVLETEDVTEITDLHIGFDHRTYTLDVYCEISTPHSTGVVISFQQIMPVGGA